MRTRPRRHYRYRDRGYRIVWIFGFYRFFVNAVANVSCHLRVGVPLVFSRTVCSGLGPMTRPCFLSWRPMRLLTSAFFLAEISVRSPRKLFFFHYLQKHFPDQSIQKIFCLFFKTEALLLTRFFFQSRWPARRWYVCFRIIRSLLGSWQLCFRYKMWQS